MKQTLLTCCLLLIAGMIVAQQKEGRVVYEQVMRGGKATVMINGESHTIDRPEVVNKMELLFGNDQSLRQPIDEERPETEMGGPRAGMTVRFSAAGGNGPDAIIYHNFNEERKLTKSESMGKKYLVSDSIRKQNWKLTGETKTILGYACQKAISQSIVKVMRPTMADGEMKTVEKSDTVNVEVWFTPAIPVPAGPDYQGQLPGLILETSVMREMGPIVTKAIDISPKVNLAAIKEPTGGKKMSAEQYKKEFEASMQEMMKRNGGMMRTAHP